MRVGSGATVSLGASLLFGDGERAGGGSMGIRDAKGDFVKRKMALRGFRAKTRCHTTLGWPD